MALRPKVVRRRRAVGGGIVTRQVKNWVKAYRTFAEKNAKGTATPAEEKAAQSAEFNLRLRKLDPGTGKPMETFQADEKGIGFRSRR